jgi:hypothetical protein
VSPLSCLEEAAGLGEHYQVAINDFIDELRHAAPDARRRMISDGFGSVEQRELHVRKLAALVAAVVSALAREANLEAPEWVSSVTSPEPFFVLPARSFAMRVRLMLESPPPFKNRRVYVPETYLSRA